MDGMGGMMWLYGFLMLAGLVLLGVLAVRLAGGGVRGDGARGASRGGGSGRSPARRRLDDRYANGELTTEEYRERVRELEEGA
ncbi:SHOCT domain-containing protein [Streptomyces sp. HK10]|uniref:SHOCT domain-containing protein n=1 Tax=Streptomyces sp. HK10 TaxID=3373255 RepID=UPI0037492D40